jgi:hypothetical protein
MGKFNSARGRDETIMVSLDEIHVPEKTWQKVMRDKGQIERMRVDFESGRNMVRVVLRPRCGGGYNVEDGRHRVIAAKLAGVGFIEAMIVGS